MAMNTVDASKGRLKGTYIAIMIPLGVAINYVGAMIVKTLALPIYLDSIGTAIVAAIMGPWVGAASGSLYNVVSGFTGGNVMGSLFAICNIGTALIIGYMARYGKYKTIPHVVIASILVALWNAVTGAPIAMIVYGGVDSNVGTNLMMAGMQAFGQDLLSASFIARIPVNLVDKGIACAIAWMILIKLPENMKTLSGAKVESASE